MNKVILMGRLVREPQISVAGANQTTIAKYTLAVDRMSKTEPTADFINCVAMGKQGEFAERYLTKGIKVVISGRIQTGSYTNKDGQKVYTTDIMVESQEFAESKGSATVSNNTNANTNTNTNVAAQPTNAPSFDGFLNMGAFANDDGLPFS